MRDLYSPANLLSLSRIALAAGAMLAIGYSELVVAALIIVVATLTDLADGAVARQRNAVGDLGRSLDAICDSIFHLTVFLAFLMQGWMPLWAAVAVYAVDISQPYLRSFAKQFQAEPPHKAFEQVKSVFYWISQLAVVLTAAFIDPNLTLAGVPVLTAIFAADVVVAAIVLIVFLRVLVLAKRRMA